LWGLKILLRRRNTTGLTKFHPLTLHTSPNSWELTKHRTCEATIVKKNIYRNQGRKSNPDFCWILFVMPQDVSIIGGNGICFVIQSMWCVGGISILFVIYGMWWNLNPACNIFCQRYYIHSVYIYCFSSVTGKRRGLTNPCRHCYGQEMRTNELALPLLWARYAKSQKNYISKSLPNFT
jgi:hypothetical protein